MASIFRRIYWRINQLTLRPVRNFDLYRPYVSGKTGLEIGGPSLVFRAGQSVPLYNLVGSLNNCDFSSDTVWANHTKEFVFRDKGSPGTAFICEGSQLTPIESSSYDFVLSSHNLEHFANPIKALHEWKRVLLPGGALILVLPLYRKTFDHRRTPTPVSHMVADFESNVGEDDLTHLPEILEKHDLSLDLAAGTHDQFKQRSLDNFNNRCLHHHVFDEHNSADLLRAAGFKVRTVDFTRPTHLCLLAHT